MAGAFSKHRFQIYNQNQHPYKHNLAEFAYSSSGLPGVTNVEEAMDWLIATIYPLTQSAVALNTDLPADGVITFSVAGRVQGASAAFSVGDLIYLTSAGTLPSSYAQNVTYRILAKDGTGLVLGQQDGSAIAYINDGVGVHTIHSIANAFRVVFDDGDGKAAAYRWEQREGDLAPSWYKVYDMDWSQDSILAQFQNITQDLYAYKMGKDDLDGTGTPIVGVEGGQHIYGGKTSGRNLTLHANSGDAPGVHSGAIRTDDPVHPTADNLFDLGTALLRYKAAYLAVSAQISTMTLSTGLITDSTGLISFDNEDLITTGDLTATDVVATNRVLAEADMEIKAGSIKSASGAISFDNENLSTTGTMLAARYNLTNGGFIREIVGDDLQFSATSGFIDFSGQTIRNLLNVITGNVTATTATLGDLSVLVKTVSSTGRVIVAPNAIDKFLQVIGGLIVSEDSTFSASVSIGVDLGVTGDTNLTGTLGVTGDTTLVDLFVNGDISTAGTFLNFLKYIVAPRLDATTVNTTTTNATTFKGTNLTDPANNTALIADIVAFPFIATTQDHVPHWDTTLGKYIAKAISYPAHSALVGLAGDDHTQYALLAGRTGGQTIAGAAAAAAGNLRLIGQAGAAGANKIIVDDSVVPGTNANFTTAWQGYDMGSSSENFRDVYSKGEHFGLRFENVVVLPAANVANIGRIVYNTTDSKAYVDLGGTWKALGTGSGGGSINLIAEGNADDSIASILTPYADSGAYPVDGVGGAPSVTTSVSAVNPLTGVKSYLLTKPASNVQGQGWAITPIALDTSYRAKSLKISFDYIVNSGTFAAASSASFGDVIWTCYDITNAKLVEISNLKMFSSSTTLSDKFEATVQFDYDCTSFRLIGHIASTSAVAFELKIDNISVSPQNYAFGTPVTDWAPTTITCNLTNQVTLAKKRRVGDSMEYSIQTKFSSAPASAVATWALPDTIDTAKLAQGAVSTVDSRGVASVFDASTSNNYTGSVSVESATQVQIYIHGSSQALSNVTPMAFSTNDYIEFIFSVPIVGLSSSVQMSQAADTRTVAAGASIAVSATTTTGQPIDFSAVEFDTLGGITTGVAWKYIVFTAGFFRVSLMIDADTATNYQIYKNGVTAGYIGSHAANAFGGGSRTLELNAGDYIDIRPDAGATVQATSFINIEKIQGPQAIAVNEETSMNYGASSGQTISTGYTTLQFNTKYFDLQGLFQGGDTAKIKQSGRYLISVEVQVETPVYGSATNAIDIRKNGTIVKGKDYPDTYLGGSPYPYEITALLDCVAGDEIIAVFSNGMGLPTSVSTTLYLNSFYIVKVK